jgi:anthranilate 1,2-dioxygenase small subunit
MISLELERRVRALHDRYIRIIDDDRLEEWPGLFTQGGVYEVTTRENHARGLPLALMSCHGRGMMLDHGLPSHQRVRTPSVPSPAQRS